MTMRSAIISVGVFIGLLLAGKAEATITIKVAEVQGTSAYVQGSKAVPNADIFWEGTAVTKANKGGNFSFYGVIPADCVGTVSDGNPIEVALLNCSPVLQAPAAVPQTGQTVCHNSVGVAINCEGTGQDGELQKGVVWPTPRFTDSSNGTITDNLTGLIWLKRSCALPQTWQEALDFVAGINSGVNDCGDISNGGTHQTDWRMPNVIELHSLVNYGASDKAAYLNNFGFDIAPRFYWSSTSEVGGVNAYIYNFLPGGNLVPIDKSGSAFVLAVRGP